MNLSANANHCHPARPRPLASRRATRASVGRVATALVGLVMFGNVPGATSTSAMPLDLERHRGRVVIVDFWASWCKPCRQSIPWLNSMRDRYGASGLTIIGVNVDAERRDADRFLRDVPLEFEIVFDPDGEVAKQFNVQAMPTSFVFDRNGKLVETHLGFRDAKKNEREAALQTLLNHPAP